MNSEYEWNIWKNHDLVCGIDEAGRGPLAGPVVAAAVVFPRWFNAETAQLTEINDSKKLTAERRNELVPAIKSAALYWALGVVDHETIDELNILNATMKAMNQAIMALPELPDFLLIDGNRFKTSLHIPFQTVVKGDGRVLSIAAASILAKEHRDQLMKGYGIIYPAYGFERHAGYATAAHVEAIRRHGRSPIHRRSFKLRQLGEKA